MERYDYREVLKQDVLNLLKQEGRTTKTISQEDLFELCFNSDNVTGNASGSYFFNAYKAEEAISHNLDLIGDAFTEFGLEPKELKRGPEFIDVTIRCYLLGEIIVEIYEENEND